jgi:hypothetical protein
MAASLLVSFAEQILKWQEPASAAAQTIYRLLQFCRRPQKAFLLSETFLSPSANQHTISVAVKTVTSLNGMIVGP